MNADGYNASGSIGTSFKENQNFKIRKPYWAYVGYALRFMNDEILFPKKRTNNPIVSLMLMPICQNLISKLTFLVFFIIIYSTAFAFKSLRIHTHKSFTRDFFFSC